jgi:hypothetical protein
MNLFDRVFDDRVKVGVFGYLDALSQWFLRHVESKDLATCVYKDESLILGCFYAFRVAIE